MGNENNNGPVWERLHYERNAIIEASAGTGKTYTLEHIVLTLVLERNISLRNILLVTFTDKAVNELRDRIRRALQQKLDDIEIHPLTEEQRILLEDDLRHFDETTISTIHSFCRRILSEYAFENGVPMATTIVSSADNIAEQAIRDVLLSEDFAKENGNGLQAFMQERAGGKKSPGAIGDLIPGIVRAFRSYRSRRWDRALEDLDGNLIPDGPSDPVPAPKPGENPDEPSADQWLPRLFRKAFRRYREICEDGAIISYDDMLRKAQEALHGPIGPLLIERLRDAYKVALVDEFQDTDTIQWDIFRTVFSCTSDNLDHFLIVVGDPKQAIYGFRGADLQTYLDARREIVGLHGERMSLPASYRSTESLLDSFNTMFSSPGWFAADPTDPNAVSYSPVSYPEGNPRFQQGDEDVSKTGLSDSVVLLESLPLNAKNNGPKKGLGNKDTCLPVFAENAAREIARLSSLEEGAFIIRNADGSIRHRRLHYGDFCFLVRANDHAEPIKKALADHRIPFIQYKEKGVYSSEEGEAVLALLQLVANPQKRGARAAALMTYFFDVRLDDLEPILQGENTEFNQLLDKWIQLANECRWNLLFESFLEDTRAWRPCDQDDPLYDRRYTTTRQILDELLLQCGSTALSAGELPSIFRKLRRGELSADEDGMLRQKETEEERVQIMTMHAAKGLEFPVVFMAYGFSPEPGSKKKPKTFNQRVRPLEGDEDVGSDKLVRRRVFHMDGGDLSKNDPDGLLGQALEEETAEIHRLAYVALTRAQYKLYLPWSARSDGNGIGSAKSPLRGGFLADAIRRLYPDCNERVLVPAQIADHVDSSDSPSEMPFGDAPVLLPPLPASLRERRVHWDSFSSIHHAASADVPPAAFSDGKKQEQAVEGTEKEEDETSEGSSPLPLCTEERPTLLPHGTQAGTAFHELMEALCKGEGTEESPGFEIGKLPYDQLFPNGDESVVLSLAERLLRANGLSNRMDESGGSSAKSLVRMAWNALRAQLRIGDTTFRLADISPEDRRAEVDFVVDENAILGESLSRKGLFNGSIDLLFRLPGQKRYFILDWKTNSLLDYRGESVKAAMDSAGYHLQYRLYTLAAAQWLGVDRLAGTIYLFVRGGEFAENSPGVFSLPFSASNMDEYRDHVSASLAGTQPQEAF